MDLERFRELPLMGIVRGISRPSLEPLLAAVEAAGLRTLEITMNTESAPELIRRAVRFSADRLAIGAGTVLTLESLKAALDAGAGFIVTPVLVREVTEYCAAHKVPVFPGAFTPQEIYQAWLSGAAMVKVFPARLAGPAYFKEIKGPFPEIELLACSGVTVENLGDYFANGAGAAAVGASVFRREWIESGAFDQIVSLLKTYVRKCRLCVGQDKGEGARGEG